MRQGTVPADGGRVRAAFVEVGEVAFGDVGTHAHEGGGFRFLAVAIVVAAVIVARRPDAILRAQFWADDGRLFFMDQLTLGFWQALSRLVGGHPFLGARVIAWLGSFVPTARAPLVYDASAIAVNALAAAAFALPGFRHLVRNDGIRAAACVAAVCVPAGQDLLTTPTTLAYYLGVCLVLLCVMRRPESRGGVALWCATGATLVSSSSFGLLAAPVWLARIVYGVVRRALPDVVFGTLATTAQLVVLIAAGVLARGAIVPGTITGSVVAPGVATFVGTLAWILAACADAAFLSLAAFEHLERLGTPAIVVAAIAVGAAVGLAARELPAGGRILVALSAYVFVASLALELAGRPVIIDLLAAHPHDALGPFGSVGTRHRAVPNVAVLLALAALLDGACRIGTRAVVVLACIVVLAGWLPGFRIPAFPDYDWPTWAARLDRKLADRSRTPLVIPIHPPGFDIRLDAPEPLLAGH